MALAKKITRFITLPGLALLVFAIIVSLIKMSQPTPVWAKEDAPVVSETNLNAPPEEAEPTPITKPDPKPVPPPNGKLPENIVSMGMGEYFSPYTLIVDKSTRTLSVWKNENAVPSLVELYPVDLGKKPGNKTVLGDEKTPEGVYFFETTYSSANLNFEEYGQAAYTMDYPNFFDRLENKTGSGIWLHAIPDTKSLLRGSRGCIVLRNDVILGVGQYIDMRTTPIIVADQVNYLALNDYKAMRSRFLQWLSQWRKSWESKDIESYISHYDDDFKSLGMDKTKWQRYKDKLAKKYSQIKVKIQKPVVFQYKDQVVVKFLQGYQSDLIADFGEKNLFIKKNQDDLKILAETWSPMQNELIAKKIRESNENL